MENLRETTIQTEPGPIPTRELSYFLYMFRAVYVATLEAGYAELPEDQLSKEAVKNIASEIRLKLNDIPQDELTRLATIPLADDCELGIDQIFRENPIRATFSAATIAFAVAVILSGGDFALGPLKVELPPVGHGIQELRAALERSPDAPQIGNDDDGHPSMEP